MPDLVEQKLSIGRDAYGRHVHMTRYRNYDGKTLWKIETAPSSSRDEGERMNGLTDDNVREMVKALEFVKRV